MDNLEGLKNDILDFCKNKFDIFHTDSILSKSNSIYWSGENFKDFLNFGEKLGIKVIYFNDAIANEECGEHKGEICSVEVGFFHNNLFHIFVERTDWFDEIIEDSEDEDEEIEAMPKDIIEKSEDVLTNEMIEFANKDRELNEIYKNLGEIIEQFWLEKGLRNKWDLEPQTRIKMGRVRDKLKKHFENLVHKRETDLSEEVLVNEMVDFANKDRNLDEIYKNLYQISEQFLLEKGLENRWNLEPQTRIKIEKVRNKVKEHFTNLVHKRENDLMPNLVEELVKWCKEQDFLKPRKMDVQSFLDGKNIVVTPTGRESLWLKVSNELKKSSSKNFKR